MLAENVTLYTIYNDVAVFVETPNHIYDTFCDPFFVESQFYKASYIIMMPVSVAYRLSEELGNPEKRVISLAHTGRAGSTLLAQILNTSGKVLTISMPDTHRCLLTTHKDLPLLQKQQLTVLIMRLLCKPVLAFKDVESIVIKLKSYDIALVPLLVDYVPWIDHVFLHRGGIRSVQSINKKFQATYWDWLMKYPMMKELYLKIFLYHVPMLGKTDLIDSIRDLITAWFYLSNSAQMYQLKAKYNIPVFTYESLIEETDKTLAKVFETCGIEERFMQIGKMAMKRDSQENSVSLKGKGSYNVLPYEGNYKRKVDRIAESLGVPKLNENIDV